MNLPMRALGASGIRVSPLGLGCWAIGGPFTLFGKPDGWGAVEDAESIRAIHRALDLGVTFFDTSDAYGAGHSETVLGKALRGRRARVTLATKGGFTYQSDARALTGEDITPAYFRRALEASLTRLQTDVIDLYQIHNGTLPEGVLEPLIRELDALKAEGKIRAYGWSTYTRANVDAFAAAGHGAAIQTKMNLLTFDAEALAACEAHGLACIANSPLAMGLLSGKFDAGTHFSPEDVRGAGHSWTEYFEDGRVKPAFLQTLDSVREALRTGGRTLAQGALGWLWAKSPNLIPIPGFKNERQAEENACAMDFGPLDAQSMRQIDALLGRG